MFDNTIALKSKAGVTFKTVSIHDLSQPGRSVRKDGDGTTLTIAAQPSKENKAYETRRNVVRLDSILTGGSNVLDPIGKISVQLVVSHPLDANFSVEYKASVATSLINFLYSGGNAGTELVDKDDATLLANLTRLLAGEI